ncbi:hypothetical protein [Pontimicrobium sp. MEBiC01747]
MNQFNTTNPNHFTYTTDSISVHILGGLQAHGLDRMRVTLKVHTNIDQYNAVRNNIDLYNANAVEKFIRKLAEQLEMGTSIIRRTL